MWVTIVCGSPKEADKDEQNKIDKWAWFQTLPVSEALFLETGEILPLPFKAGHRILFLARRNYMSAGTASRVVVVPASADD